MRKFLSLISFALLACNANHKVPQTGAEKQSGFVPVFSPGPPALVYKTKSNYNNLVPVILSEDKTEIVSYPHPKDIKTGNSLQLPLVLNEGYLLDNRGIGKNVAFLKMTYADFARLEEVPGLKELYAMIIDKDPLAELCDCGNRAAIADPEKQLNKLIDSKKLRTSCKVIK